MSEYSRKQKALELLNQDDRKDAAGYTLNVLDKYSESILCYLEDYRALHGAAVAVRKSLEIFGAALLRHETEAKRKEVTEGREIRKFVDAVPRPIENKIFAVWYKDICSGSDGGVNSIIHYQFDNEHMTSFEEKKNWLNEKEKENLYQEHCGFRNMLVCYAETLNGFIQASQFIRLFYSPEEYPNLKRICDGGFTYKQTLEDIQTSIGNHYQQEAADPDPWMSWHCITLNRYQNEKNTSLNKLDTMAVLLRKITERNTYRYLCEHNMKLARGISKDATLEDYKQKLEKISFGEDEREKKIKHKSIKTYIDQIMNQTNALLHWYDGYGGQKDSWQRGVQDGEIDTLFTAGSAMMGLFVLDEVNPKYVWEWIGYYKLKWQDLNTKLAKAEAKNRLLLQKNRKRGWIIVALAGVIGLSIFACVGSIVLRNHEFVSHYADYVWKNGVPQGIFELTKAEAGERAHYRIVTQDNKVRRVERVNAGGEIINESVSVRLDRAARMEISYRGEEVDAVVHYDAEGNGLYMHRYTPEMSGVEFFDAENPGEEKYIPSDVTDVDVYRWQSQHAENAAVSEAGGPSHISEVELLRSGADEMEIAFGRGVEKYTDMNAVKGLRYTYDRYGRISEMHCLYETQLGKEQAADSLVVRKFIYDQGNLTRVEDVLLSGNVNITIYRYDDETGDCTAEQMRTLFGDARDRGDGVTDIEYVYKNGQNTEIRYLNKDGNLTLNREGHASVKRVYDEQNRCVEEAYYNAEQELIVGDTGYAVRKHVFEGENETISYYNAQGDLVNISEGYALMVIKKEGASQTYSHFDVNGVPAKDQKGVYQWRDTYDEMGYIIRVEALDAQGERMTILGEDYAYYENKYDSSGRIKERRYYDVNGKLQVYGPSKTSRIVIVNSDGSLVPGYGYAIVQYDYTPKGQLERESYYGIDEKPIQGCAVKAISYDEFGREKSVIYLDKTDASVMNIKEGYAQRKTDYGVEEDCTWIRDTYLDENSESMFNEKKGAHAIKWVYDDRGNNIGTYMYDGNGSLMNNPLDGVAYSIVKYNEKNQAVYWAYYDAQNHPVVRSTTGYAAVQCTYDQNDRMTDWTYYDANGNPMVNPVTGSAGEKWTYDVNGRITRKEHFDEQDAWMVNEKEGYAILESHFDEKGNEDAWAYYGADGLPMIHLKRGYASFKRKFNEHGKVIESIRFDENGDWIVVPEDGCAAIRSKYDDNDREIEWTYYGTDGKPMIHPKRGYASLERSFDEFGNEIAWAYYGIEGELICPADEGYARAECQIDTEGRKTVQYYDESDLLIDEAMFDKEGRLIIEYFDMDGKRIEEYWVDWMLEKRFYDTDGDLLEVYYYDEDEEIIRATDGKGNPQ